MCSQFQPTTIIGKWRSGNAVAQPLPTTKMGIPDGNGWLNRSRILLVKSRLSCRHLRQKFVPSSCRSDAAARKDGRKSREAVLPPLLAPRGVRSQGHRLQQIDAGPGQLPVSSSENEAPAPRTSKLKTERP